MHLAPNFAPSPMNRLTPNQPQEPIASREGTGLEASSSSGKTPQQFHPPQETEEQASLWSDVAISLLIFYLSSVLIVVAVLFGQRYVSMCELHSRSAVEPINNDTALFAVWDGEWYHSIVEDGYSYDPNEMSNVAFYPLYPATASVVRQLTGCSSHDALFITSHAYLLAAFLLFAMYLRRRQADTTANHYHLLALGVAPITFWMHMSYSESCFLAVILLAMIAMQRNWPVIVIALLVGLCTAARPVGVAAILPFLWHLRQRQLQIAQLVLTGCVLLPLCIWGLASYSFFQWWQFSNPFAFIQTQENWFGREASEGWIARAWVHLSLEPMRGVYDENSPCCWKHDPSHNFPLFNMQFMAPIFVLTAWVGVGFGFYRKILTLDETLLACGLFAIPYLTHSFRHCMNSDVRYMSVAFPIYILCGTCLSRLPSSIFGAVCAVSGALLAAYTALFTRWYLLY